MGGELLMPFLAAKLADDECVFDFCRVLSTFLTACLGRTASCSSSTSSSSSSSSFGSTMSCSLDACCDCGFERTHTDDVVDEEHDDDADDDVVDGDIVTLSAKMAARNCGDVWFND